MDTDVLGCDSRQQLKPLKKKKSKKKGRLKEKNGEKGKKVRQKTNIKVDMDVLGYDSRH